MLVLLALAVIAATTPAPSTLEVATQPPGVIVYLDDERIGTTDLESGRLVRSDLPPGRHGVRLALAGYADSVEDIELAAGGRTELRRRLKSSSMAAEEWLILSGVVAAILLALTAWARRRAGPG